MHIHRLFLHESLRNSAYGSQLMNMAEAVAMKVHSHSVDEIGISGSSLDIQNDLAIISLVILIAHQSFSHSLLCSVLSHS